MIYVLILIAFSLAKKKFRSFFLSQKFKSIHVTNNNNNNRVLNYNIIVSSFFFLKKKSVRCPLYGFIMMLSLFFRSQMKTTTVIQHKNKKKRFR